jgi:hypothetical protein
MRKTIYTFLILLAGLGKNAAAQELNATVNILSPAVQMTNKQIFETLETSIRQFVNSYKWTNLNYELEERIDCAFILTINNYDNNTFSGTMQVQYSRLIYNSDYNSPVLSFIDKDLVFNYIINEPLEYQPNSNISNLTSLLAFYCNMIIGIDRCTFEPNGGEIYFNQMQNIVSMAQSSGVPGWRSFDGTKARYWLSDNLNSPAFEPIIDCFYQYHRNGLDNMYDPSQQLASKTIIKDAIVSLQAVFQKRPNALLLNTFFDAKSDEIVSIFSDGPKLDLSTLISSLKQMDAGRTNKYDELAK